MPSSPPSTQAAAGAFIRKSKKSIKPKARTRKQEQSATDIPEAPSEETIVPESTNHVPLTPDPTPAEESAAVEDVAQRLQAALASQDSQQQQSPTTEQIQERASNSISYPFARSTRSRTAAIAAAAEDEPLSQLNGPTSDVAETLFTPQDGPLLTPVVSSKGSRKRKQNVAERANETEPIQHAKKRKIAIAKPRLRKILERQIAENTVHSPIEIDSNDEHATERKPRERRRKRATMDEDAANHRIATNEVRMGELVADTGQGQVSVRETRLRERDEEKKKLKLEAAQARAREELQGFLDDPETSTIVDGIRKSSTAADSRRNTIEPAATAIRTPATATPEPITPDETVAAPKFRIVNGQIVADESSRVIDRRAERTRAAEAAEDGASIIIEDDLSRRINSRSFTKYDRPTRWNEPSTALFHKGLQWFGLEFSMMCCLFPGRSRRQLKAKFIREERADVSLVNALLRDRKPLPSQEELEKMMGKKLKDPRELDEELRMQRIRLEEAQRVEDQMLEDRREEREREAEVQAARVIDRDADSDGDGDGGVEAEPEAGADAKKDFVEEEEDDEDEDDSDDDDDDDRAMVDQEEEEGLEYE